MDGEVIGLHSGPFSGGATGRGFSAAGIMGLTRGGMTRTDTSGGASCEFEGAFVTLFSRAAAAARNCFCSLASTASTNSCLSRGCAIGVCFGHGEFEDVTLSARGPIGVGGAVGKTVGFTIR